MQYSRVFIMFTYASIYVAFSRCEWVGGGLRGEEGGGGKRKRYVSICGNNTTNIIKDKSKV